MMVAGVCDGPLSSIVVTLHGGPVSFRPVRVARLVCLITD